MSKQEFLKYLINEDIYALNKDEVVEETTKEVPIVHSETTIPEETAEEAKEEIIYKEVLILVEDKTSDTINDQDKDYLSKILSAVNIDLLNVSLLNVEKDQLSKDLKGIEKIISFTTNHQLNSSLEPYQIDNYDGIKVLLADPLNEVSKSVENRKKLWEALKTMFH